MYRVDTITVEFLKKGVECVVKLIRRLFNVHIEEWRVLCLDLFTKEREI